MPGPTRLTRTPFGRSSFRNPPSSNWSAEECGESVFVEDLVDRSGTLVFELLVNLALFGIHG